MKTRALLILSASLFLSQPLHAAPEPAQSGLVKSKTATQKVLEKVGLAKSGPEFRQRVRELRANSSVLEQQSADVHASEVIAWGKTNGNYYAMSDLHMGLGRTVSEVDKTTGKPTGKHDYDITAADDRQEDFTRPKAFAAKIKEIAGKPGRNTLVLQGDIFDILEHANPDAGLETTTRKGKDGKDKVVVGVKDVLTQIINGHQLEFKTLANAVVTDGLRVLYSRGNHDVRLLEPGVREHMIAQIVKIADLSAEDAKVFQSRVAFTGHMTPLGTFEKMFGYHDEHKDPTNGWRNPANPYSTAANGTRAIPWTLGDHVAGRGGPWNETENNDPDADNRADSSSKAVIHQLLISDKFDDRHQIGKFLWHISKGKVDRTPEQLTAERLDDRKVLRSWVERTGFDKTMNAGLAEPDSKVRPGDQKSPQQYAKLLETLYHNMPKPVHERMTARLHTVNLIKMVFGGTAKSVKDGEMAEAQFLKTLAETFPEQQTLYTSGGHDHAERNRFMRKGERTLTFDDTGTWTRVNGEDRLNVLEYHTDETGHMAKPVMTRASNLEPEPRVFEEKVKVEGWQ